MGNGVVVDQSEDPAAFADALSQLLSGKAGRTRMGKAGRALAFDRFSWDRVAGEKLTAWNRTPTQ